MYRLTPTPAILRLSDGAHIPADPANTDYAAYLQWLADGNQPAPVPSAPVPTQAQALRQIDADVDAIYTAAIGNRGPEYEAAEFEALSYQAAGFAGDVPPSVASWVAASGMTAQAAALDIIAQGNAWRQAAQAMRAQRLQAKAGVRSGAIAPTLAAWSGFVAQMRAALGVDA